MNTTFARNLLTIFERSILFVVVLEEVRARRRWRVVFRLRSERFIFVAAERIIGVAERFIGVAERIIGVAFVKLFVILRVERFAVVVVELGVWREQIERYRKQRTPLILNECESKRAKAMQIASLVAYKLALVRIVAADEKLAVSLPLTSHTRTRAQESDAVAAAEADVVLLACL